MLEDHDLQTLETLLDDSTIKAERYPIEVVDGLIAAAICAPRPAEKKILMPRIWRETPSLDDTNKAEELFQSVNKLYSETYYWLSRKHRYQPIYLHWQYEDEADKLMAAKLWAVGFLQGNEMHGTAWQSLPAQCREAMSAILVLGLSDKKVDDLGLLNSDDDKDQMRHEILATIPFAVQFLYNHWHPEVKTEKAGRNEPCPCGSGKKYKKCCLLIDTA